MSLIDFVKVILTALVLIKASFHDLREREVPDELWILMIVFGLVLDAVQYLVRPFNIVFALIQFVLIFLLANFMFYVAGFGGADAKALIALSVVFPTYPKIGGLPVLNTGLGVFAFTVLSNSVIVAPLLVLILFVRNLREDNGRLVYRFIGVRVDADRIPKFHNLLEYVDDSWNVVRVVRGVEPDEEMLRRLKEAKRRGILDRVWVTPALPFLVFMTAGFFVAVLFGDVLVWLMLKFI